jgi:hypothetical protein
MGSTKKCRNITKNRECIKIERKWELKCAKTAKNEQAISLLARIDL